MYIKRIFVLLLLVGFVFVLGGCATSTKKGDDLQVQGLRDQISLLESQVELKDDEISDLKDVIWELNQKQAKKSPKLESPKPSTKDIQMALSSAGFDPGKIDGKMGQRTKEAVRAFQKANDLKVDGKAGKETWGLLQVFLEKPVK
ncbi:MAG: peptidoglycan-binding protein [Candidatus Omnitrophica bacterium]|nr:peptidoglycan-binding protein [Candidatus Omnitrophota bacterium]